MQTIAFKLGGRLLELPDLVDRLREVIQQFPHARPLVIVGGGEAADLIRRWDQIHRLGEERAHHLALQAMAFNEQLLAEIWPEAKIVASHTEAEIVWARNGVPVLCVARYLRDNEPDSKLPLPHTWEATSDSIAAWVAWHWPADGLVLLKSVPAPAPGKIDDSRAVDPCFPRLARCAGDLYWCNIHSADPQAVSLKLNGESGDALLDCKFTAGS